MRLEMPYVDRRVESGAVAVWHKSVGDWVDYGEDLCDLSVREVAALDRSGNAQLISRLARRPAASARSMRGGMGLMVRITASDTGRMRRIVAPEGSERRVGELLAVLTTSEDEPLDREEASIFRVVATVVEEE